MTVALQVEAGKDLQKAKLECENLKRQLLQQEINFNIQKTEALTRWKPNAPTLGVCLLKGTVCNSCPVTPTPPSPHSPKNFEHSTEGLHLHCLGSCCHGMSVA